jgi:quercetin dioxygenase-like cupin family protein
MITELSAIEPRTIIAGHKARFIHTANVTLAFWEVEKGAVLPLHSHLHEQTTQVMKGRYEYNIDGVKRVCEVGTVIVIPSNVTHGGIALTDCEVMDVFSPIREDYRGI